MIYKLEKKLYDMKVLILGATGGIGRELAKEFSKDWEVYGTGRNLKVLEELKSKNFLKDYLVADVSKKEDREKIVKFSANKDWVIYSFGLLDAKPFEKLEEKEIENILDVNLKHIILLDREFLKLKKLPNFLYFLSISSLYSWYRIDENNYGGIVYQASKTGLLGYLAAIRLFDKENNLEIKRIGVYPDTIKTESGMSKELESLPKIPVKVLVQEVKNIVEGKYDGEDFLFIINDDGKIYLEKLEADENTLRPLTYKSRRIKYLGMAQI